MYFDSKFEFNSKKVKSTIIPYTSSACPVCGRKYTVYYTPMTCEYFVNIGECFCDDNINSILLNAIHAKWIKNECDEHILMIYVNIESENNFISLTKYALYKQLIPNYIRAILCADKQFLKEYKCLLSSPVIVKFTSNCNTLNTIEPYGSLKHYSKRI